MNYLQSYLLSVVFEGIIWLDHIVGGEALLEAETAEITLDIGKIFVVQ